MKRLLLFIAVPLSFGIVNAQKTSSKKIQAHIKYLASDELKGRGTSSPEEIKAAEYIAAQYKEIGLSSFNNSFIKPFVYKRPASSHDTSTAGQPEQKANNVVGFLDNKAPLTIVIGAHYDHLGLGHDHNSREANPEGKIHNGADDNASGTAGVIELARYFAKNKKTEPYNFLFVCFSGEELGLLGSKKYVENPDVDLKTVNYMINLDMVGRLKDNKLVVYGVGTSPVWVPLVDSLKGKLEVKKDSAGIGPSDQTSFYLKDIPVLHFFTGQHEDYHKPTDDENLINYKGEAIVLDYIADIIEHTYRYPKLSFQKTRNPENSKAGNRVSMGVMPDYTYEGGDGLRVDGVTDNKPAARAGIKKDDVIQRVGDIEIKNVQDYMKALGSFKKGDSTKVVLKRGNEKVTVDVTFN